MAFPLERPLIDPTAPVLAASPIAFWRFENDLTDDASVGPYDLALTAGTETYVDAGNGKTAFSFDGSTYMTATGYTGILGSNPRAVSAWIKTNSTAVVYVCGWGNAATGERWDIRLNSGLLRCEVQGGGVNGNVNISDGAWHHIAVVLESGDDNINQVKLYTDAVLNTTSGGDVVINTVADNDLNVGNRSSGGAAWDALMDEVAIFDGLTSSEILAIYQGGRSAGANGFNWKESTDEWVTTDLPRSGGRYKTQLVSVSDQGIVYFGSV